MAKKKKNIVKPAIANDVTTPSINKVDTPADKSFITTPANASSGNLRFLEKLSSAKMLGFFAGILVILLGWVYKSYIGGKLAYMFKDIGSDSYNLIYPQFYHHAAYIQKYGTMPQWSFEQGLGQNVHPFWFDPISAILFLIFKTDSAAVMIWMQVIYMFLAGIFFFLYLKTLQIKNLPALIGGLLFTFCGYVIIGGTWTVDKFPLEILHIAMLLYSVEVYLSKKQWALFPIAIALVGIHQPFDLYLYGIMLFAYITVRYAENHSLKTLDYGKHLLVFLVLGIVGVGIGSFQLWSNLQQMIDSPRVSGDYSYANTLRSSPVLSLGEWKQYSTVLLRMFSSDFLGDGKSYTGWQNYMEAPVFYCGFLSLLLAPQFFFQLNRKQQIIYGTLLGLSLLIIIFPYLRYAFWLFTGDYYRTFSLLMVCLLLFFSMRALNFLYENGKVNVIALAITSVLLLIIVNTVVAEGQTVSKSVKSMANIFLLLYTGFLFMSRSHNLKTLAFSLIAVFSLVEVVYFSSNSLSKRDALTKQELNEVGVGMNDATVDAVKYLKEKDPNFYRIEKNYMSGVAIHGSTNDAKIQGYNGTRSYHSFNQLNYVKFLESVKLLRINDETSSRWLFGVLGSPLIQRLCNVKYFLAKGVEAAAMRGANQDSVAMFKDVKVFVLRDNLPLGITFDQYIPEADYNKLDSLDRQIAVLQAVNVNKDFEQKLKGISKITSPIVPSEGVTLDALKAWTSKLKLDTLQITSFTDNLIKGKIQINDPKILFLAIPFDKGWSAKVDGKETVIEKVDAGLMGILLEKGKHEVKLAFTPPTVKQGSIVSIASILLWGAAVAFFSFRKKKNKEEAV
ncbi:YfhO family protein [Emticicia fontis]